MNMYTLLFLGVRALHVGTAALWIGSTVFTSVMMMPAVDAAGPSGGQVMMRINRRGLTAYMAALAATTVLSGLYLYWHFTGFNASIVADHAGLAFGMGGVSGVVAAIVGGAVVGRSAHGIMSLGAQAAALPDGPAKGALMEQASALRRRLTQGTRVVIALQTVALVLMAVGHYV